MRCDWWQIVVDWGCACPDGGHATSAENCDSAIVGSDIGPACCCSSWSCCYGCWAIEEHDLEIGTHVAVVAVACGLESVIVELVAGKFVGFESFVLMEDAWERMIVVAFAVRSNWSFVVVAGLMLSHYH